MKKELLLQNLNDIIKPIVDELGYELYHIEYIMEDEENYLRIYIDKPDGITLEDCEKVSRPISEMLDVKDPISEGYYLEVSSPGMFRELFNDVHLERYINYNVNIKLESVFEGKKSFIGILKSIDEDYIYINEEGKDIQVPREKIKMINLEGSL